MAEIVFRQPPEAFKGVIDGIAGDLRPLLELAGQRLKEESVQAFQIGAFDGTGWAPQYPGVPDSRFVNIAAALEDLNRGRNPKDRRFRRKRPLYDTGTLARSIAFDVTGPNTVRVGTTVEYAANHQFGGESSQPVTSVAKDKLRKWLRTKTGKLYGDRLAFLLDEDTLTTRIKARPFLGATRNAVKDIKEMLARELKERIEGGDRGDS